MWYGLAILVPTPPAACSSEDPAHPGFPVNTCEVLAIPARRSPSHAVIATPDEVLVERCKERDKYTSTDGFGGYASPLPTKTYIHSALFFFLFVCFYECGAQDK